MSQWEALWQAGAAEACSCASCRERFHAHLLAQLVCPGRHTLTSVITTGGLHGKVHAASESVLTLDIGMVKGSPVRVDVERSRIESVNKAGGAGNGEKEKVGKKGKGGDAS